MNGKFISFSYCFFVDTGGKEKVRNVFRIKFFILTDLASDLEAIHPRHVDVRDNEKRKIICCHQVINSIYSVRKENNFIRIFQILKDFVEYKVILQIIIDNNNGS